MRQSMVYRHGGNEANQRREGGAPAGPGIWDCKAKPEKMPVLRVDADSPEDACRRAAQSTSARRRLASLVSLIGTTTWMGAFMR